MSLRRFLKYINILMVILLVVAAAGFYWFAWRPLPRVSGTIDAPVSAEVTISRDSMGVPHIQAGSIEDAIFAQGFVTAQERMFQMDMLRRRTAGELAEIAGPGALDADKIARVLRIRRLAEDRARSMPPEEKRIFAAYARGVNYYLELNRNNLPVEFRLARFRPRPWSVADSIVVALGVYRLLTETWQQDVIRQQWMATGDPGKVKELFPVRAGSGTMPGSNAWVVSGQHTASGLPILANDPHLPLSAPSLWFLAHLEGGDLDVTGGTMPGIPGVLIGHNRRITWGVTNLGFDVQDLYAERIDPNTHLYQLGNGVRQASIERQWIAVAGQQPQQLQFFNTVHGPVVASAPGLQVALQWTAAQPDGLTFPFIRIGLAQNWDEFRAALADLGGPAQNFVYADADGNIGYQVAGRLPIRNGFDGSEPLIGADPRTNWAGDIPFDELPSLYNPESGIIVTANQNPFPEDYPYQVSGEFAPPYRAQRIRKLLEAREDWKPEDMLTIQGDIHDAFLLFVAQQAVQAYEARQGSTEELDTAAGLLRDWNGEMQADAAAPLLASLVYRNFRDAAAESAAPNAAAGYRAAMAPVAIERLLRQRPDGWFDNYDQVLVRCLVDAVEAGKRQFGDDIQSWRYGDSQAILLRYPAITEIPEIGSWFDLPAMPRPGSPNTVRRADGSIGPSLRLITPAGDWDNMLENLPPGESGHVLSSHSKDEWDAYWNLGASPSPFTAVEASNRLVLRPER